MIVGKKQRDVKFIIYQSLYILVIAMLGAKHVTINNIPPPLPEGSIIITQVKIDSLNNMLDSLIKLSVYDSTYQTVVRTPDSDSVIAIVSRTKKPDPKQPDVNEINRLRSRNSSLESENSRLRAEIAKLKRVVIPRN